MFKDIQAKSVLQFLSKIKCPVCKSGLDIKNIYHFKFDGSIKSVVDCLEDYHHYDITVKGIDTGKIKISNERISFEYMSDGFSLSRKDCGKIILNEILIYQPSIGKDIYLNIEGDLFNFRKFSPKKFADKINVIRTFG